MSDVNPIKRLSQEIVKTAIENVNKEVKASGESLKSIFENGKVYTMLDKVFKDTQLRDMKNLNSTLAGSIAQQMDAQDGTVDGFVDASVWNQYADEHGGNQVKNKISVVNAMNSITTYIVREAAKLREAVFVELKNQAEQLVDSEPELPAKNEASESEDA